MKTNLEHESFIDCTSKDIVDFDVFFHLTMHIQAVFRQEGREGEWKEKLVSNRSPVCTGTWDGSVVLPESRYTSEQVVGGRLELEHGK